MMKSTRLTMPLLLVLGTEGGFAMQEVDLAATWVARNCVEVQRTVFADPKERALAIEPEKPLIVVRLGGEFTLETKISLYFQSGRLVAEVVQAEGIPLCQQLETLRRSHADLDVTAAVPLLKMRHRIFSEQETPGLAPQYRALRKVAVSAWPGEGLFAPGRGVTVSIQGMDGHLEIAYSEPDPTASSVAYTIRPTTPQRELSDWVQGLLAVLKIEASYTP